MKTVSDRKTSPKSTYSEQVTERSVTSSTVFPQSSQNSTSNVEVDGVEQSSFDLALRSGPPSPMMNNRPPSVLEPKTAAALSSAESTYTFSPSVNESARGLPQATTRAPKVNRDSSSRGSSP